MKTLARKVLMMSLIASASTLVACSKGSSDEVASTPLTPFGACVSGCPVGGGVQLMNATSRHMAGLSFAFQVFGNGGGGYGGNQIALGGSLNVVSTSGTYIMAGYACALPNGPYYIQTIQGGQLSGSVFSGIRLRAIGQGPINGLPVEMTLHQGHLVGQSGLEGDLTIESVGGAPCQGGGLNYFLLSAY